MKRKLQRRNDGLSDAERQIMATWLFHKRAGFATALDTAKKAQKMDPTGWAAGSVVYYRTALKVMRFLLHHVGAELPPPEEGEGHAGVDVQ
jgi:hypothetical protein